MLGNTVAGYIPAVEVLATGVVCNDVGWFTVERTDCSEPLNVVVSVLAAVTLIIFVPYALMMSLVYFDDNPRYFVWLVRLLKLALTLVVAAADRSMCWHRQPVVSTFTTLPCAPRQCWRLALCPHGTTLHTLQW